MNELDISTILQSPEAQRMRRMVTEGFYDRSRIGLWLFEVIGREYDSMAHWAREFRLEGFPQTCTWSISIWEFVYGINPDDTLSLEYRQGRILSKKLQHPPINPARIEAVLSALTGCLVTITENIAAYTFRIEVDEENGSLYSYHEALKTLREIKPSHLSFEYISNVSAEYSHTNYDFGAQLEFLQEYFIEEREIITTASDWSVVSTGDLLKEYFSETSEIVTQVDIWSTSAAGEFVKEEFVE